MEDNSQFNQQPSNPTPPSNVPPSNVPPSPQTPPVSSEPPQDKMARTEDKVFAALSYISVLFVIPLIVRGEDKYIKFHAKQGMVLFGAELVVWFVLFLLESLFVAFSPLRGFGVLTWLGALSWIVFVVVSLLGVYYAWMGKRWKIFLLHRIADRIKI